MKRIIKVIQQDNAPLHLTWIINNICTNACSYCPENLHNGTNHNYDWGNARTFLKLLFDRYPKIHCTIAGGEPSVSPFFPEIVKMFYDKGHTVAVTSNAAMPAYYWEDISQYLTYICFSYHPEFPDPNFIEKASRAGVNTPVCVRILMQPKHWDQCVEMYNTVFNIEHIRVEPVRILNWNGKDSKSHIYTNEQLQWFNDNLGNTSKQLKPFKRVIPASNISANFLFDDGSCAERPNAVEYINAGLTNFVGYECEVGLKSLFIHHQGEILLSNCAINGPIGNINDPSTVNWPTSTVICNKTLCHCSTDVGINKWKL